jgi:TM2 domain-containing membrane protein YozV
MDCVNHSGVNATAFCQNCGKPLCQACVKTGAGGQIFCEPCWMAWNGGQQPFVPPPVGAPNPVLAAMLGLIPGVGAMYNGQLIKGLVHVLIFAVLVSMTSAVHGDLDIFFGLMIPAWIFYQAFEAYHTAKARRDGEPLPDPLGLSELTNLFGTGGRMNQGMPPAGQPGSAPGPFGAGPASSYQAPGQAPSQAQYEPPYQTPYQTTYQGPTVPPGYPLPDLPPVPPVYWRRKEPIGAIILIALGVLFLLGHFDWFSGRVLEFTWPILLIGLGVWLIVRRLSETKGSSQANSQGGQQ